MKVMSNARLAGRCTDVRIGARRILLLVTCTLATLLVSACINWGPAALSSYNFKLHAADHDPEEAPLAYLGAQLMVRFFWGVDPPNQGVPPTPTEPYLALLKREADCRLTRLTFDDQGQLLASYADFQDFVREQVGLPGFGTFASGCTTTMTGTASQAAAYLGATASGNQFAALLRARGVGVAVVSPSHAYVSSTTYDVVAQNAGASVTLASADLDADGNNDVVVGTVLYTTPSQTGRLSVFRGRNDGTLDAPQTISLSFPVYGITIDHLNGDNVLDIAAINASNFGNPSTVAVLLGQGGAAFGAPIIGPQNVTGNKLVTGYFNADGHKDLATSDGFVLLGDGTGHFTSPFARQFQDAGGNSGNGIAAADFNGDGHRDLAITGAFNSQYQDTVAIFLGTGDGRFNPGSAYATLDGAASITAAELDGDGTADLLVGTYSNALIGADDLTHGEFQLLLGRGDGTFAQPPAFLPQTRHAETVYAIADVTGDGRPDIVRTDADASGNGGRLLTTFSGNGDSTFARGPSSRMIARDALTLADFNGDGNVDAAFGTGTAAVGVARGNGDGTFQAPTSYSTPAALVELLTADLNGDTLRDLVLIADPNASSMSDNSTLQVLLNTGTGNFASPATIDVRPDLAFVAIADVTGDGVMDLVATAPGDNLQSVAGHAYLYVGNGDGTFDPAVALTAGDNPGPVAIADVNGDSRLDILAVDTSTSAGGTTGNDVIALFGNGAGGFLAPVRTAISADLGNSIAAADLDGDGDVDAVVGNCCGRTRTYMLFGRGDGTFSRTTVPLGVSSRAVKLVDVTADGYPEIVLSSGSAVEVFPNAGASAGSSGVATTTALTASPASAATGQAVTLTATVTPASGATVPTGSVVFFDGSTSLGTQTLDGSGRAVLTTAGLSAGSHSLTASYGGSVAFAPSASSAVTVQVGAGGAGADFSMQASPASLTVAAGQSGTTTLTVTPSGGFAQAVTFSCSGLPVGASCSFSPASVTPSGGAATATLTIGTNGGAVAMSAGGSSGFEVRAAALSAAFGSLLMFVPVMFRRRATRDIGSRAAWTRGLAVLLLCVVAGCGGSSSGGSSPPPAAGTPGGTSTVTVTAIAGSGAGAVTHTVQISLTVTR